MIMAVSNYLWSCVWTSPLQKTLPDHIQMHDLKEDATLGSGSFGVVTKLKTLKKKNKTSASTLYIGRKIPEKKALSDAVTKKATLQIFPEMVLQLCSLRHTNIVQMQGIFFSDSVSYLPTLVYEEVDRSTSWITLDCFLLTNRSEVDKVTILEHVASGLEYLHNQKPPVLHLNLTVANVMVFQDGPTKLPRTKIADVGVVSLVNAGRATLVQPRIVDYLPEEEKSLEWTAKVDVLCYGLLMGHLILQVPIIKTLPIFWGDIVSNNDAGTCQLHEQLQVHPLYFVVLKCLNKRQQSRTTAFDIREEIQNHVSFE